MLICSCQNPAPIPVLSFSQPRAVDILGYTGNAMEPFLSREGTILLFNNLNSAPENTNLHWATRITDSTFQYKGELKGINTPTLEAVASLDSQGTLYFVSDRNYSTTLSSIYTSTLSQGTVTSILPVEGLSKMLAGWVNFDAEVDAAGETLYSVDGRYDQNGGPYEADIFIAVKVSAGFQRLTNSAEIMKNINTAALEYAACISANGLEFYFTRLGTASGSVPEIFSASRKSQQEPFGVASKIVSITGFVEAPTISSDGKIIYFHKNHNGKFVINYVRKK